MFRLLTSFINMEEQLESDIIFYQQQLSNIQAMMDVNSFNSGDNITELTNLKDEIELLLQSSEANLLDIKKEKLLNSLQDDGSVDTNGSSIDNITANNNDTNAGDIEDSTQMNINQNLDLIFAPYYKGYGVPEYHTAFVITIDKNNSTILYTHPCYSDMIYCENFLGSQCHLGSQCKYSHGKTIQVEFLKEIPSNYFNYVKNKECLVKLPTSELWEKAIILDTFDEIIEVQIHKKSIPQSVLVQKESVWFFEDKNNYDEPNDVENDSLLISEDTNVSLSPISLKNNHNNNFVDRMMYKMGYIPGMGLGKSLQGTIEPVHIYKAPKVTSLDLFMTMKTGGQLQNITNTSSVQSTNNNSNDNNQQKILSNPSQKNKLFNVLNNMIKPAGKTTKSSRAISFKRCLNKDSNNLNLKIYQISEDIRNQTCEITSIKQAINRNISDKRYTASLKKKLNAAESQLAHMINDEKEFKAKLERSQLTKKMASFK